MMMSADRRTNELVLWTAIIWLTAVTTCCQSANILFFQPYGSMSHTLSVMPALEGLATRGKHNVTFLGLYSPKPDNASAVNWLQLQAAHEWYEDLNMDMTNWRGFNTTFMSYFWDVVVKGVCRQVLADPSFRLVVANKATTKYDAIIVDPLLSECGMSLVWLLDSPPLIFYCTTSLYSIYALTLDIPTPLSYVPTNFRPFTDQMTFAERTQNLLMHAYSMAHRKYVLFPAVEHIVRQTYPQAPSLMPIEQNASFVFSNSYSPALDYPRPLAPFFAEVGGIHCRPARPMPKDLEDFVQGAGENGFIYFSLGTNIKGKHLPPAKRDAFINAFRRIKQRVVWKFEDKIDGLPPNVRIYKWLSQQDFLGHPKIKMFITQCGQLSTQEAIYHGVPVLGVPFIGEQFANIRNLAAHGMGEELDYDNLNEDMVCEMLHKISNNASYREKSRRLSKLMHDRPMDAIDTIVYWTGYVIRHDGAHHLRLNTGHLNIFQYFLLDVIGAILATLAVVIFVALKVIRVIYRAIFGRSKSIKSAVKKLQ